jgi:hypothetical protein
LVLSVDNGEFWQLLVANAIQTTDPDFGNYPVTMPPMAATNAIIRVEQYGNTSLYGQSGAFDLFDGMGVSASAGQSLLNRTFACAVSGTRAHFTVASSVQSGSIDIFALGGNRIARLSVREHELVWQGGAGTYAARLTAMDGFLALQSRRFTLVR